MRPLIFILNVHSGGQRGAWLYHQLELRNAGRVVALSTEDLQTAARTASEDGSALVACGGDGTAASCLEASWIPGDRPMAPVGVIPLGTGNDLSRWLGWGSRLPDPSALDGLLVRLQNARTSAHDRWVVEGPAGTIAWFNYLSIGTDARVALRFHRLRRLHPWMFRGQAINRAMYGAVALSEPQLPLSRSLDLARHTVPAWARAVVFTNIGSYAGGTALGRGIHAVDGHLDGFLLGPGSVLGLAAAGVRRPHPLGAMAQVDFTLRVPTAMQIDGEPSVAPPGRYSVRRVGMVRVLMAR